METPTLEEVIRAAIRTEVARVHTQVPGRVLSYDHTTQRAKIQLIVDHAYLDPETGERVFYTPPPLVEVPVTFGILTWPLSVGTPGWVEFAERSTDEYRATGRDNTQPADARRFDLSDAVFSPCYFRGEADADASATILSTSDLRIRSSSSAPTQAVALAAPVEDFIRNLVLEIVPHIHSDPLTGTTGPSPGPFTPPTPTEFDSANVEAE